MVSEERATVLVVDDEPAVADVFEHFLREEYETRVAYGGEAGLDALDDTVDVVLLDRRMPELSGDAVLAAIADRGLDCRVVMVTAVDPDFDLVDMPFDDYLCKPVDRTEVLDTVQRLCSFAEYDDGVGRLYAMASKAAAIEAEKAPAELASNEEYQRLLDRMATLHTDLAATVNEFEDAFGALG